MNKVLKYAAISGIVSFMMTGPVLLGEYFLSKGMPDPYKMLYAAVIFTAFVFYTIFAWGFKTIGEKYQIKLLVITSLLSIALAFISNAMDIVKIFFSTSGLQWYTIILLVIFGVTGIFFGIGMLKLKPRFGAIAQAAGVLEIICGISFVTLILSLIGVLLQIPIYILEVMLLFKAAKEDDRPAAAQ